MSDTPGRHYTWIKLYKDGWLTGTTRYELSPEERSVFIDLLLLAANPKSPGIISPGFKPDGTPFYYPLSYFTGLLMYSEDFFLSTLNKLQSFKKISFKVEDNKYLISINNFKFYQSEYLRQKQYRNKKVTDKVTSEVTDKVTSEVTFPSVSVSVSSSDLNKEGIVKGGNPFLKVRYDKSTQKWEGIDDAVLSVLKKLYPSVEIEKQIEAAGRWIYGHDKQYKDMKRFLCNWMDNVVNERFQKSNNKSFKDSDIKIKEI